MSRRREQIRWIALLGITAGAMYVCWLMLVPFLEVLAWATVLVIVFYPAHKRIQGRIKSPTMSALLSTVFVIVAILIPLALISFAVFRELSGVSQYLQNNLGFLLDPKSSNTGKITRWLEQYINVDRAQLQAYLTARLKGLSESFAATSVGFAGNIINAIVEFFFIVFTIYYLFRDSSRIRAALCASLPLDGAQARRIFERTGEVIHASVNGVVIISAINGTLGGLAFWVLGLPAPVLWGVVMMLFSMIPMLGAFVVWLPAAIYLAATGHWTKALLLTAWGGLIIGSVDNFLRPKLVSEKVNLHELLIFFSIIGGLQVFGMLGIILGPVVVAFTLSLLDTLRQVDRPAKITLMEPTLIEEQAELRNAS
jgi:predicted PurR-regulated permease PerM